MISESEYAEMLQRMQGFAGAMKAAVEVGKPKANKYHARKKEVDGITFASSAEARRYIELKALKDCGEIGWLKLQPTYQLAGAFTDAQGRKHRAEKYVGDFEYVSAEGIICEDVKGVKTPLYRSKIKRAIAQFPDVEFREVK